MRLDEIQREYTATRWSGTAPRQTGPLAMLAMQNTVVQCPQHFPHLYLWCNICDKCEV